METLRVAAQTGPHQSKTNPPKRYYVLTFADTRKSNYFPKDNEIPYLIGMDVDVDLQQSGQYWNIKSLEIHGAPPPQAAAYTPPPQHSPAGTEVRSGSAAMIKIKCLKVAATVISGEDAIIATAEKFFQYIIR